MSDKIKKTEEFLKLKFDESSYYILKEEEKKYRIEHSYRVANIGKEIALKEGLNVESLIIACLLHDVSYSLGFKENIDWLNHGRNSAKIAKAFLEDIGLEKEHIDNICYGIAIHVDDKADFEGDKTPFTMSISDADNIDRFDVYRIYENLERIKFDKMTLEQKLKKVNESLEKLNIYKDAELGTKTATNLWHQKIVYQIKFFNKLKSQINNSYEVNYHISN